MIGFEYCVETVSQHTLLSQVYLHPDERNPGYPRWSRNTPSPMFNTETEISKRLLDEPLGSYADFTFYISPLPMNNWKL